MSKLLFSVLFFMFIYSCTTSNPIPKDEVLIQAFNSGREKYATLADLMLKNNREYKIYPDDSGVDDTISKLIRDLKLLSLELSHHGKDVYVEFLAYAGGALPDDGIYKGYVFFPMGFPEDLKGKLVTNLDVELTIVEPGTFRYSQINKNWYLWFLS
jgi:hypothetical protein